MTDGRLVHAAYASTVGVDAFFSMLAAPFIEYEMQPGGEPPRQTITGSVDQLLLEAARRTDELAESGVHEAAPTGDNTPGVNRPRALIAVGGVAAVVVIGVLVALLVGGVGGDGEVAHADPSGSLASTELEPVEAGDLTGPNESSPELLEGGLPRSPVDSPLSPTIVCRVLVGPDGRVRDAHVYQQRPELAAFERAAVEAARHFTFRPARRDGEPIPAWINYGVTFED